MSIAHGVDEDPERRKSTCSSCQEPRDRAGISAEGVKVGREGRHGRCELNRRCIDGRCASYLAPTIIDLIHHSSNPGGYEPGGKYEGMAARLGRAPDPNEPSIWGPVVSAAIENRTPAFSPGRRRKMDIRQA